MIALHGDVKILIATKPVDFRKGVNGLVLLVEETLKSNPYDGTIFVFRSKRNDRLKLLTWDGTGVVLATKWLEAGCFTWPPIQDRRHAVVGGQNGPVAGGSRLVEGGATDCKKTNKSRVIDCIYWENRAIWGSVLHGASH